MSTRRWIYLHALVLERQILQVLQFVFGDADEIVPARVRRARDLVAIDRLVRVKASSLIEKLQLSFNDGDRLTSFEFGLVQAVEPLLVVREDQQGRGKENETNQPASACLGRDR